VAADLLDGLDLSYAADDGMPFPGWAPPPIDEGEARERYEAGDRFAVLAGTPTDPDATLVVDRRNNRVVVTRAVPRHVQIFTGKNELMLTAASWTADPGTEGAVEWAAERRTTDLLRLRRRPGGAAVWLDELLAGAPEPETAEWPEFGSWSTLAHTGRDGRPQWWDDGALEPVDADGWLLDELEERDIAARWRELARKQDAPRAYSQPPEVQAKLAEPRGWRAQGRRWRRTAESRGATLITDVSFVAGAGGGSDVTFTVTRGSVEVVLGLPAATGRLEARVLGLPRSPAQPRPSASAQVGITAVLDISGEAHDAILAAITDGAVPDGWTRLER
jgi:hypothetical protein